MRGKWNSSTQKLISSLLWKFLLNSAEFKMFCRLAPACQDSDYVNLSYQTFKVVKLSSKLMSKRDFNAFLQIHVSVFCAEPSINILDQLSCLGLVFVIFTYFLCHFYVTCCYMIPFKQIVFPKSKCHEPQLFCLFAKLLLFWEIF